MIQYLAFGVLVFLVPLFLIPLGAYVHQKNSKLAIFYAAIAGVLQLAIIIKLLMSFNLLTEYNWVHLVIGFIVIGAMNNGNRNPNTPESSKEVSTYLFSTFTISSIIYLFL